MKATKIILTALAVITLAAPSFGQGRKPLPQQEQSKYLVSVKAGAVNLVAGDVSYKRGGGDWDILIAGDELSNGDSVKTGANGVTEILLSPGSYLRLSQNSELVFSDTALANLKLRLLKGSAIIEASLVEEALTIVTPKAEFSIVRGGLYRFDVESDGAAEVAVRKGKVKTAGVEVGEGKKALVENGIPALAKFDKKAQDDFDAWSKERAKTLIAANRKLSSRAVNNNMLSAFAGNIWVYNPLIGCYTFLPGHYGFTSPYGLGYTNCYRCSMGYYPRTNTGETGGGYPSNGGSGGGRGNVGNNPPPSTPRPRMPVNTGGGHRYKEPIDLPVRP